MFLFFRSFKISSREMSAPKRRQQKQEVYLEQLRQLIPGVNGQATSKVIIVFSRNGPSQPLFRSFSSFQTNITIFTTNVEKCTSSIQCRDLNSQPFEYESPPITTRTGLPPNNYCLSREYSPQGEGILIGLPQD